MSAELVPLSTHPAAALPAIGTPDVVNAWLRARNPNTLRGYLSDLNTFREWLGATSTAAAVDALLSAGQAGNQWRVYEDRPMDYDAWDIDLANAKLSPTSTVRGWETLPAVVG